MKIKHPPSSASPAVPKKFARKVQRLRRGHGPKVNRDLSIGKLTEIILKVLLIGFRKPGQMGHVSDLGMPVGKRGRIREPMLVTLGALPHVDSVAPLEGWQRFPAHLGVSFGRHGSGDPLHPVLTRYRNDPDGQDRTPKRISHGKRDHGSRSQDQHFMDSPVGPPSSLRAIVEDWRRIDRGADS